MKKLVVMMLSLIMVWSMVACNHTTLVDSQNEPSTESIAKGKRVIDVEEMVIFNTEEYLLKIIGYELEGQQECNIKVYWENKNEENQYMVIMNEASINGIAYDGNWGFMDNTKKHSISFEQSIIQYNSIDTLYNNDQYTDFQMTFTIHEKKNWEVLEEKTIHFYPYGEEQAMCYKRELQSTDTLIMDNTYVKIFVVGYERGYRSNDTLKLYIENKTDNKIGIGVDALSINGERVSSNYKGFYKSDLHANSCKFESVSILDVIHIKKQMHMKEIELKLHVYPVSNLGVAEGDDFITETVTLNPGLPK